MKAMPGDQLANRAIVIPPWLDSLAHSSFARHRRERHAGRSRRARWIDGVAASRLLQQIIEGVAERSSVAGGTTKETLSVARRSELRADRRLTLWRVSRADEMRIEDRGTHRRLGHGAAEARRSRQLARAVNGERAGRAGRTRVRVCRRASAGPSGKGERLVRLRVQVQGQDHTRWRRVERVRAVRGGPWAAIDAFRVAGDVSAARDRDADVVAALRERQFQRRACSAARHGGNAYRETVEVENVAGSLIVICHRGGLGFVSMLSTT
jgi:hypothetical protein